MKIEVWTDFTCPFCYISRRLLDHAIKTLSLEEAVKITYRSYILYPHTLLDDDETIEQTLSKKYGISEEEAQMMMNNVAERAQKVGLTFHLVQLKPRNTKDAHRLAKLAAEKNVADQMQENLMHAFFYENKDLTNKSVLKDIALSSGLNMEDIQYVLRNSAIYEDEVEYDLYIARKKGVRGIPYFIVNDMYTLSGAQPVSMYVELLEQAISKGLTTFK